MATVVYNSFEGRFSDSTRVLFDALRARLPGAHHVWIADPAHAGAFPPGVTTVEYRTSACVEALEAADLLVANTHTDVDWTPRPDALYLQVWHGTPLKRIHNDVRWAPPGRLARLDRDVARWDVLVSPSPASTPRLRGAFGYRGEVIETGYPRNDLLLSPEAPVVRARVRRELGVAEDARVVLYAPTWRDDAVFAEGGREFALGLDVDAFDAALGDDHVLLLRLHYMLGARSAAATHRSVRDVSAHPDVSELYLAADVLVTDYSSAMFDFALTRRPILFLTYDLADYRDRLRGFYFDLEPVAPGPLLGTTAELIDALRALPQVTAAYAARYAAFLRAFGPLEDGHATDRVLARILRDLPA